MARFLYKVSYTKDGMQGVIKEGAVNRRATIEKLASEMGGSIESFDYAFGDTDIFVITEMPDHITAAAVATAVAASGAATIETVVLLSPEDVDQAIAKNAPYRAPGA
ncbi:MAG TPA: GYD domain-containing protein [Actinomycetota bacterium]|nr:GYD domain-containing protein [Actinomycetota bacterium]